MSSAKGRLFSLGLNELNISHWGWNKINNISQTAFLISMEMTLKFVPEGLNNMIRLRLDIRSNLLYKSHLSRH